MQSDGAIASWRGQPSGVRLGRWLGSLDAAGLCAAAKSRTGLGDFGAPSIEPAFSTLARSLEQEAELHPLGRFLMRVHLLELLETRLRLADLWREDEPCLEGSALERPVFIVGMPRSGSTFLHELLAEDPSNRAPRVWEIMSPLGCLAASEKARRHWVRKAEFCLWCFRTLAPEADRVYPMRACTPHECVAIHSYTFLSEEFVSTCNIPSYEAFLHSTDLMPAYAWQRRFLQYLQWNRPRKRWVLKSPDHVYGLEELFKVFPDAHIIQTHRNPVEVMKSSADLTRVLRRLYGYPAGVEQIRAREARVLADSIERFLQFRDLRPDLADRFIDVRYAELVANPVATVRRIYSQLQAPLTDDALCRIRYLASARSRYGGRRASAEPGGVDLRQRPELEQFDRYCSRFGLPHQQADAI